MANLIGFLNYGHHAGTIHRLAHKTISSRLATWRGNIETEVDKEGNYSVSVNGEIIKKGNINIRKTY